MGERLSWVYILSSRGGTDRGRTLYVGVTSDLPRRIVEHKAKVVKGFTANYNVNILVYFEMFGDVREAIVREKQIKGWLRSKKIALIERVNPGWKELAVS